MAFYIQYDENGNIESTVQTDGPAPARDTQLVFPIFVETLNKRVNLETMLLEDIPLTISLKQ